MPEGPEIKRSADVLATALSGKCAHLVEFAFPHLATHAAGMRGQIISAVEPRGKAMLTQFDHGVTIYSHNQLYGQWRVLKHDQAPQPGLQIRMAIHTDDAVAVLYSASDISVWPSAKIEEHPYIAKLGVELLGASLSVSTKLADVMAQINAARFARKSLAALLLDQGFLAGIGNYLRSEILFVARIHPRARLAELAAAQRLQLAEAALNLTRQSYRTGGITNDVAIAQKLKSQGVPYGRYRHWVFDREGEKCHICGDVIERIDMTGRGLYCCMRCQVA
jgi:endonuclease VIII